MKKIISIFSALFILLCGGAALAEEPILNVHDGLDGRLTVNTINVPHGFNYNDIIYIPMTSGYQALLGIDVIEDENGITIESKTYNGGYFGTNYAYYEEPLTEPVAAVEKPVSLNGQSPSPGYPFARRGDTLYFPLTWSNAKTMGWTLSSADGVITLFADSRFAASRPRDSYVLYGGTYYYVVSGTNCARIDLWQSRFFNGMDLEIYNGNEFVEYKSEMFPVFYPDNMEFNGNELTVTGCYYGYGSRPFSCYETPDEIYNATIDLTTLEMTDTVLIKRNVYNKMYSAYGDENGRISNENILYETSNGDKSSFAYEGGHVILNGTVMRGYSSFIYMGSKDSDGEVRSYYAGRSGPYWIRVEDLENYGYDMVVDYENRVTYFTRNPKKEVIPISLDGTNEGIPVYRSDWRIFIDGVEPQRYFNIGGYTMVNSGELGEYVDETTDSGFKVRYVTTPDMVVPKTRVFGYYDADKPLENLNADGLTDVVYLFISPDRDNGLLKVARPENLKAAVEKAHSSGVRIYAALRNDLDIVSDEKKAHRYVESAVWLVREYGLDGIKLDKSSDLLHADLYIDLEEKIRSDKRIPEVL